MTELRDARLKQALEHAPDAHMAPDAKTRAAILARASQGPVAAAPVASVPWWKRLTGGFGSGRMPWNAALATVLLASLVTVIWRNEEIPDAKTGDRQIPSVPTAPLAPRAEPETSPSSSAPPAGAATSQAPAPAAKPESPAKAAPRRQAMPAPVPSAGPAADERRELARDRADAMAGKAEAERSASMNKAAPSLVMPEQKEKKSSAVADAAPAVQAQVAPAAPAFAPPPPLADRAARMQESARAPAAAATGSLSGSAASTIARPVLDIAALDEWTQVRIAIDGRSTLLMRDQAGNLPAQARAMALAAARASDDAVVGPEVVSLEMLRDGVPVGRLSVSEGGARWQQLRVGFARSFAATADEFAARELIGEARRLVTR